MSHYHKTLGLRPTATKTDVKSAFRRLSKKYHPDLNSSPDARFQFMKIHEAYKFLTSTRKRTFRSTTSSFQQKQYSVKKAYYARKKEAAQDYAKKKSKEANRKQRVLIKNFMNTFRAFSIPVFAINILLAIDFVALPLSTKEENISHFTQNKYKMNELNVHLESEIVRISANDADIFYGVKSVVIQKTMLLGILKGLKVNKDIKTYIVDEPSGKYPILKIVGPLISIVLLLVYFKFEYEDFKFSGYIVTNLMALFELLIYSS